jgi:PmbA protein
VQTSYALKVHRNRRKGSASTNETSPEAITQTVDSALTLAEFSVEDEFLCLPEAATPRQLEGRFDPALRDLPIESLRELAARFVSVAQAEPRMSLDQANLEVATGYTMIANSHGLRVADESTSLGWRIMGMGKTDEEVTSFDYLGGHSFDWQNARERCPQTASTFVDKQMTCFGARKGESYKGMILLTPAAVGSLLLSPLQFHIDGRQVMDGKSRWGDELGKAVASDCLTLVDDPFDLALAGAAPFDGEGVPARETAIIENGVLRTHIDGCYTARRRGLQSTGHADGLHGVHVRPGTQSRDELLAAGDRMVVVERFSGNVEHTTGDFSGVAKCSHYYENGEHRFPLKETMIAGNFFEMLKSIVALGDRSENYCNAYLTPYVLVDGVSVTAG